MTLIFPISDLHIDIAEHRSEEPWIAPQMDPSVVVVAAGDISEGAKAPGHLRRLFPANRIVYVLGNHDYYTDVSWGPPGYHYSPTLRGPRLPRQCMDEVEQEAAEACAKHGVDLLRPHAPVTIDGTAFFGGTLWSDLNLNGNQVEAVRALDSFPDCRWIGVRSKKGHPHRLFTPGDMMVLNANHVLDLTSQLANSDAQTKVVVTHHAPHTRCRNPDKGSDWAPAFVSDMDAFLEGPGLATMGVKAWIFGHTHFNRDFTLPNGVRVVSNQQGYLFENYSNECQANKGLLIHV